MSLLFFVILCYDNFCTKTDTSDTSNTLGFLRIQTQQRNTKENTKKKTAEINCL